MEFTNAENVFFELVAIVKKANADGTIPLEVAHYRAGHMNEYMRGVVFDSDCGRIVIKVRANKWLGILYRTKDDFPKTESFYGSPKEIISEWWEYFPIEFKEVIIYELDKVFGV